MKKPFLAWQDPESRHWCPIGKLIFDGNNYHFTYTKGVKKAKGTNRFRLLHSFPERDGLRYMPECSINKVKDLEQKERLYIMSDFQNYYDKNAFSLRTKERHNLGYFPRYLVEDFWHVITKAPYSVYVVVEKVNPAPTPIQFRLLCSLTAKWDDDFIPLSG